MTPALPPGPRQPQALQTIGWWTRPISFLEANRRRYGKRFTMRLLQTPPFVMLSDPDEIREVFTAPPEVLHPGEGARILEPVIGSNSVILLDEGAHLEQRKLMLPAFHGEKMQRLSGLMAEVAERQAASWPRDEPVELHPRLQDLTLEVILRAVFGLDPGPPARRDPRAAHADPHARRATARNAPLHAEAARRPRTLGALPAPARGDRRAAVRADRRAPRGHRPSATTCWRCCWRPATRTARRCPTASFATS